MVGHTECAGVAYCLLRAYVSFATLAGQADNTIDMLELIKVTRLRSDRSERDSHPANHNQISQPTFLRTSKLITL